MSLLAGLGTRALILTVGAADITTQISKAVIVSGKSDSDFITFADAAGGGAREYRLEFTAVQDMVTATLWDKVFTTSGTDVAYLLKPYGNAVASATQPHFSGMATITEPNGDFIGGDAKASTTARMTFECSWVLTAKPTKVIV